LGKIGDHTDADVLLKGLSSKDPTESSIASSSLARIEGPEVDALILKALILARDADLRLALIDVLDARSPAGATGELLRQAADPNPKVGLAAFRALRSLVGAGEVPALISLTKNCREGSLRAAAEETLNYACTRTSDPAPAGKIVLAELKRAADDVDRASWIKALAATGYAEALPTIAASLSDANAWLVGVTIDNLGKWRGPAPIDHLLAFAETAPNPAQRGRALTAAIQLAATAGAGRQAPDNEVAAWFQRTGRAARSAGDRRVIISGLARWQHEQSILLLLPYLDDSEVKSAASLAILAAAEPVATGPGYAMLKPVLDRIASETKQQSVIDRIAILRRAMAATEAALAKQ
jgi:HEAT repeat protein